MSVNSLLADLGVDLDETPQEQRSAGNTRSASAADDTPLVGLKRRRTDLPTRTPRTTRRGRLPAEDTAGHDPARERPLITTLTETFPSFNTRKLEASVEGNTAKKRALTHHNNLAGSLSWSDRMRALADVSSIISSPPGDGGKVVIYAGGYPGHHVKAVAEMFEDITFYAMHHKPYEVTDLPANVVHKQRRFDAQEAAMMRRKFVGTKTEVILIADTWSEGAYNEGASGDAAVVADLQAQKEWVRELRPTRSSLKFWLPQVVVDLDAATTRSQSGFSKTFSYFDGIVQLPSYGPADIAKSLRLEVTAPPNDRTGFPPSKEYDCLRLARQVLFFIKIARPRKYNTFQPKSPSCELPLTDQVMSGMNWRYDASSEAATLLAYLKYSGRSGEGGGTVEEDLATAVGALSAQLSSVLGTVSLKDHPDRFPEDAAAESSAVGGENTGEGERVTTKNASKNVSALDQYLGL